ncbi:hypothetical protein B9G55_04900 [Saccharibacillus sp. O16]|nr:hypothetical protein B9G55_04900 [Saccharibacillus sp. O16]
MDMRLKRGLGSAQLISALVSALALLDDVIVWNVLGSIMRTPPRGRPALRTYRKSYRVNRRIVNGRLQKGTFKCTLPAPPGRPEDYAKAKSQVLISADCFAFSIRAEWVPS